MNRDEINILLRGAETLCRLLWWESNGPAVYHWRMEEYEDVMEKITEEMAEKVICALYGIPDNQKYLNKDAIKNKKDWLRDAGLLAPAEIAYEKARRLRRDMEASAGYYLYRQEKEMADAYEQDHAENVAEIDRLKAEKWTDEDMKNACRHGYLCGKENDGNGLPWDDYIAARRAAKGKE